MDIKQIYNKYKTLIWIALLLGLLVGSQDISDKKEGLFSGGTILGGLGLLVVPALVLLGLMGGVPLTLFIGLLVGGLFFLGTGISGALAPTPSIPAWAWIAGFLVLILLALRRKK